MLNCLANLQGDIGNNIPCENLVKILASANSEQKKCVANATYQSVRKAALTTQIQDNNNNKNIFIALYL